MFSMKVLGCLQAQTITPFGCTLLWGLGICSHKLGPSPKNRNGNRRSLQVAGKDWNSKKNFIRKCFLASAPAPMPERL